MSDSSHASSHDSLREQLRRDRLLAIIRGTDRAATVAAAMTLVESGTTVLEVSLTGAGALEAISEVVGLCDGAVWIGAGTVISERDAEWAADHGATFMVTPGHGPGTTRCLELGLPVLGGALSPTEIMTVSALTPMVKLFPAGLGGPDYLRSLRAPFPDIDFVPVGGVDAAAATAYLQAGAMAVGVGSPLLRDAADAGGDLVALTQRAAAFRLAVAP